MSCMYEYNQNPDGKGGFVLGQITSIRSVVRGCAAGSVWEDDSEGHVFLSSRTAESLGSVWRKARRAPPAGADWRGCDRGPGGGAEQGEAKAAGQMCAARVQTACDAWAGPCQGHAPSALTAGQQSLSPTGAGCCRAKAAGAIWAALHEARGTSGCSAGSHQQAARGHVYQDWVAEPAAAQRYRCS